MKGTEMKTDCDLRQATPQEGKPLYQCPRITIHGSAQELTQALEDGQLCDAVQFGNDPCS